MYKLFILLISGKYYYSSSESPYMTGIYNSNFIGEETKPYVQISDKN